MKKNDTINTLHDIREMMTRSSCFISLSGLSGIAAGVCALVGVAYAHYLLENFISNPYPIKQLRNTLLIAAGLVFITAFLFAFLFTYIRSKKINLPIWGSIAKRLVMFTGVPFIAGSFIILRLIDLNYFDLLTPVSLIVYGIAIFCGSFYSTIEIRYLAFSEMILGSISLWLLDYSLFFWAFGFGILHIVYGFVMWIKYERK